ncbi:MAG TPA: hypothetical protein VFH12_09325, partial [Pseudoxanthomonas sp.]|nr:hypothetical protein [Pseudoxanthomonas sp.]
ARRQFQAVAEDFGIASVDKRKLEAAIKETVRQTMPLHIRIPYEAGNQNRNRAGHGRSGPSMRAFRRNQKIPRDPQTARDEVWEGIDSMTGSDVHMTLLTDDLLPSAKPGGGLVIKASYIARVMKSFAIFFATFSAGKFDGFSSPLAGINVGDSDVTLMLRATGIEALSKADGSEKRNE